MPGTPFIPPVRTVVSHRTQDLQRLPKARSELITLLHRLTIDVERMASSSGQKARATRLPEAPPHYYFHFMAKTLMEDSEGLPFADAETALRHAKVLAAQFSESGILFGCTILVARDDEVLFEVPLSRSMN
jgi:hypothetical protein